MIWVDITNLPHVRLFKNFIKKHEDEIFITAREFGMLTALLDEYKIEYTAVGKHGGRDKKEKLVESSKRIAKLAELIPKKKIKLALSKHSVELPRVAFGLRIPIIQVVDNEYAEQQNRLSLPLCSRIIIPRALDKMQLLMQGAAIQQLREFNGLCEVAHIKDFKPHRSALNEDYILLRPEPYAAAYFESTVNTQKVINSLKKYKVVVIPRGKEKYKNADILKPKIDILNLIYHARAVIGGGGTMNRESALLGTPTISYYPQQMLGVDKFLIQHGLMFHAKDAESILGLVERTTDRKKELRKKAVEILSVLEDPLNIIEREINSLAAGY